MPPAITRPLASLRRRATSPMGCAIIGAPLLIFILALIPVTIKIGERVINQEIQLNLQPTQLTVDACRVDNYGEQFRHQLPESAKIQYDMDDFVESQYQNARRPETIGIDEILSGRYYLADIQYPLGPFERTNLIHTVGSARFKYLLFDHSHRPEEKIFIIPYYEGNRGPLALHMVAWDLLSPRITEQGYDIMYDPTPFMPDCLKLAIAAQEACRLQGHQDGASCTLDQRKIYRRGSSR